MIHGIGVDIVSVNRILRVYELYGDAFIKKLLSAQETERMSLMPDTDQRVNFLAKRFAAKEAYSKAIGTGMGNGMYFAGIDVSNDKFGKPYFSNSTVFSSDFISHLSISDDSGTVIAYVVLEKR